MVAYGAQTLSVVDVSDPTSPTMAGSLVDATDLNGAQAINVVGNYAYVASYLSDSLTIVDVSTPTTPTKVGSLNTSPSGDLVAQCYLPFFFFWGGGGGQGSPFKVTNPQKKHSALMMIWLLGYQGDMNGAHGLDVSGNYAYVVSSLVVE